MGLYTVTIEEKTIGEKLTTLVVSDESWAAVTTKDNLVPYVAAIFVVTDEDAVQKDASVLENPIRENSIAFSGKLPVELDIHKYVDYNTMLDKSFLEPMKTILDCLGWSTTPIATLDDLF